MARAAAGLAASFLLLAVLALAARWTAGGVPGRLAAGHGGRFLRLVALALAGTLLVGATGAISALGDGAEGRKASGMLMVDGVLYMWVRNAGNAGLAWSSDRGRSWTWSDSCWSGSRSSTDRGCGSTTAPRSSITFGAPEPARAPS